MLIIKVSKVDELYDISLKLGVTTYLLVLVTEHVEMTEYDTNLKFGKDYAIEFLLQSQMDVVADFRRLIESKDFTIRDENGRGRCPHRPAD